MTSTDDDQASRLDAEWSTLMVAAQAGDRVAHKRLLHGSVLLIRRVARWQRVPPGRVDGVIHETLRIVHRARRSYDPSRSFSAWLCAIARRRAIANLRNRRPLDRPAVFSLLAYKSHFDPGAEAEKDHPDETRGKSAGDASNALAHGQREAIETLMIRQLSPDGAATFIGKIKGGFAATMHGILKILLNRFG